MTAIAYRDKTVRATRRQAELLTTPHLLPAFVAVVSVVGFFVAFAVYARGIERRYIHALAPKQFDAKNQGSALQKEVLRHPDLLPIYGSSELLNFIPYQRLYHGSEFFKSYPTGFTIFPIGKEATTPLLFLQKIAGLGEELRGKKIVISLCADWYFNRDSAHPLAYAGNYSRLHAYQLAFSFDLGLQLRQEAAKRMLAYPKTLEGDRLLKFALENLSDHSPTCLAAYHASLLLGRIQTLILVLQDHWETVSFISKQDDLTPEVPRTPIEVDWQDVLVRAEQVYHQHANNNPFGFDNDFWRVRFNRIREMYSVRTAQFLRNLDKGTEWTDLDLLLQSLRTLGAQPLLISAPIHGGYWEHFQGISYVCRRAYYEKLRKLARAYNMALQDFADHDCELYFTIDQSNHLSPKGWMWYNRAIDAFYHQFPLPLGPLPTCSPELNLAEDGTEEQARPTITASPNPVPCGSGVGKTTISWSTGDATVGQVYVSVNGALETEFGTGPVGSQVAPWIRGGLRYEFRLYSGTKNNTVDRALLGARTVGVVGSPLGEGPLLAASAVIAEGRNRMLATVWVVGSQD
jgi:D-alanine transfer protein